MGRVFFNTRKNVKAITAAYTVLASDSGTNFMVSGGSYTITLPTGTDLIDGLYYKFINSATPGGDIEVDAGTVDIVGVCQDAGNGAGCSTTNTPVSDIIIEVAGDAGDWFDLFYDGTKWYFTAMAGVDTAFTTT